MADIELIANPQAAAASPWAEPVELVKERQQTGNIHFLDTPATIFARSTFALMKLSIFLINTDKYPADSVFVEQSLGQLRLAGQVTHVFTRYAGCTSENTPLGRPQEDIMPHAEPSRFTNFYRCLVRVNPLRAYQLRGLCLSAYILFARLTWDA
ncbi:hypothetical protein BCR43DRAFT_519192 [Syncephalastrum racemosum]|uniref:Uncharacterized protein n=1 Tax=Syncephalastrum racemosum TaxID=13706 RepID=A0A1X2GZL9_SYNRA|nr:hypothetical protein BCR43DRAFT_519192 [Syncephalastrum racemosum]